MLKAFVLAAFVASAIGLPQLASRSEERFLSENSLVQLFASGDVVLDLASLVPSAKIFVPDGKFFNRAAVVVPAGGATVGNIQGILNAAVQTCQTCGENQYTSTVCGLTSDTVCSACKSKPDNEYLVASCRRGEATSLGANTQTSPCKSPESGYYVKKTCGQENTQTLPCSTPNPDNQYIRSDCVPGTFSSVGTDTDIGNCDKPSANQWVKKTCDAKSNSIIQDCSWPEQNSGNYISTACQQGTLKQAGSNAVIVPCTVPGLKQYTTKACSRDQDTTFGVCDDPIPGPTGTYTTKMCKQGSATGVGQNTQTQSCKTPNKNEYYTKDCVQGTWQTVGQNAEVATCSSPAAGFYTTSPCTSTSNTKTEACKKRETGYFITRDCDQGTYDKNGANTQTQVCDSTKDGSYVSAVCTDYANTGFTACSTAADKQFIEPSGVCVVGSAYVKGSNANVKTCTVPAEGSGKYIKTACTKTSDAEIVSCDPPASNYYTTAVCTPTSNTVTAQCKSANDGEFVSTACSQGTATSAGTNTVVKSCQKGGNGYYVKTACTRSTDSTLEACSEPASGSYVTATCTETANTATSACTTRGTNQYFVNRCTAGSSTAVGTNANVKDCTNSKSGFYVSKACTEDADTVFTQCKTAGAGDYTTGCSAGTAAAAGADNQVLPTSPITCGGSKTGNADAARGLFGDSVYPLTISSSDEVREVTFSTCGSDATFALFSSPTTEIKVTSAPCDSGQKGARGFVELTTGTYTVVVKGNTAGPYTLTATCADQTVLGQQRFQLFKAPVTFDAGKALCAAHGMALAHITSVEESNAVGALAKAAGVNSAYAGANDIVNEGFYKLNFNEEDVAYTKWAPGEPNNVGAKGENCVEIYQDGNWNDIPCDFTRAVACSKYKASRSVTTANQLYVHFRDTTATFANARQTCANNGMKLAHVTNANENQAVASLVTATPSGSWIGITDYDVEGSWAYTAFNTPIVFTSWAPNEPNNYQNTDEDCVQMYTNGNWNDLPCSRTLSFVCSTYLPERMKPTEVQVYVQFNDQVNFATAQANCKANGLNVAIVSGSTEASALSALLTRTSGAPVWIGAFGVAGSLVLDGTGQAPAVFKNFNSNPTSSNYCVESDAAGKWNAVTCDGARKYVCSGLKDTQSSITNTQRFVIFPRTKTNYQDAMNLCSSYGLQLAHNIPQAQVTMGKLVGKYSDSNAWVGANDIASERNWVNQLGGLAATINWNSGEPNDVGGEDCAELRSDGLMNDVRCDAIRRVLCSGFLYDIRTPTRRFVVVQTKNSSNKLITCESIGLYSDPPNSAAENKAVSDVCANIPGMTLLGAKKVYGKFISDKTQAALPYSNFNSGEGNTAGEDCLRLRFNADWNDFTCSGDYAMRVCVVP